MEELDRSISDQEEGSSSESASAHKKKKKHTKKKHSKQKAEIERLNAELQEKTEECKDLRDRYLRALADLDNYRKRVRKDMSATYEASRDRLICNVLPVLDNLERALNPSNAAGEESFRDGVNMIYNMLKAILEREGVREFCSVGKKFDPSIHEAVYAVESSEFPADTVVDEVEKGYTVKERLLRPARVTVSKGSPESLCQEDSDDGEPSESEEESAREQV